MYAIRTTHIPICYIPKPKRTYPTHDIPNPNVRIPKRTYNAI